MRHLTKHWLFILAFTFSLPLTAFAITVTVSTPTQNSQVGAPIHVVATANSNHGVSGWHIYLDSQNVFSAGSTNSIDAYINASPGSHQLVTRAWDDNNSYGDVWENITVTSGGGGGGGGGGNGLPTPPPNAIVFNNVDEYGNWGSCHNSGCAGGSGSGTYWMAQHQNPPSQDGSATEFFNSGVWGNALWWQKVGANNNVHNLLWDFYFYVDNNSLSSGQALEFDAFQFVGGYNYMIGSECNYGAGVWDTWDEASGHWVHTSISCPRFSPNTWHHVQWYMTTNTSAHQYKYVTLVVDGNSHTLNWTGNAKYLAWGDNLGVQWQLDVNASGQGYHEWIDRAKLTVW